MQIRPPAVAGTFYPGTRAELLTAVDGYLAAAQPDVGPPPKAVVVPHAGYVYSGPIAGSGWAAVRPIADRIRRVVMLGPAHREWADGSALPGGKAFATPLGECPIDQAGHALAARQSGVEILPEVHAAEHSLEVQVPFIQRLLPQAAIVPILVGGGSPAAVAALLDALWGGEETLIAVSTDLSHYLPYAEAQRLDRACADAVLALDDRAVQNRMACGHQPLRALLRVARARKLAARLLDLRNSGDTQESRGEVVGYAAFAFS
jgi:AmmeMemoRadiSam system protein B